MHRRPPALRAPRTPRVTTRLQCAAALARTALAGSAALAALGACADRPAPFAPPAAASAPGRLLVPVGGFTDVGAGQFHSCARTPDGAIQCWGGNAAGQSAVPAGLTGVAQLAIGAYRTCVVTEAGTVACWGGNGFGESTPPAGLTGVVRMTAGYSNSCAVRTTGTVTCWGSDTWGLSTPPAGLTGVTDLSAGATHVCAVTAAGAVTCWGNDQFGQATPPAGLANVVQVSAGQYHTCAVTAAGTVACWGRNDDGRATPPAGLTNVVQVSAGGFHSCAVLADGTVRCWGDDSDGRASVPAGLGTVARVSAGVVHNCALTSGGAVTCWGYNYDGQLNVPKARIRPAAAFAAPASVPAGQAFTLALSDARVPGGFASTFTYAFDCGDGLGYGAASAAATRSCPTAAAGSRAVRGRVVDQDGDATEYAATVAVTPVTTPTSQVIVFTSTPPNPALLGESYAVAATGGASGNPVTFSALTPATCTVSGATVRFTAVGPCAIAADQAAGGGYAAAEQRTQTVAVVYAFAGFFAPVENLPAVNAVRAGSAVPLKFSLGGDRGLAILAAGSPSSRPAECEAGAPAFPVEETVAAGASGLRYDAASGQYVYTWKTDRAWAGSCRRLEVTLADGTRRTAAFQFTR